ncbi:MAG: stage III sporulation protein AB [Clostridia bacterium]|nr:stage III sporulation protein AB [Clostridia bacterium]
MKVFGFLLVLTAGVGLGWYEKQRQNSRIRALEWFERFLECTTEYIRFASLPIGKVLQELAKREEFSRFSLLQAVANETDFRVAWQREIQPFSLEYSLSEREKELFSDFMNGFGKTDVIGEMHYCEQYRLQIHQCIETERTAVQSKGRLYIALGFCGGGLMGLLLI